MFLQPSKPAADLHIFTACYSTEHHEHQAKKIIRISAICLLVILFVLAGAEIWITRKIEAAIEHTIREQGGVPNKVHVGSISIYPLNRTIRLKHLVFGIDFPAKGTRFDLQMDRLTAGGIRLQGKEGIEFGSIDLDSPVVTLSRRTGETLTDTIRRDTTKSSDLHSKFKDVLPGSIRVTDGSIRITEEKGGRSITHSIQHLSFSTSQLSDILSSGSSISTATDLRLSIRQIQYQFDLGSFFFCIRELTYSFADVILLASCIKCW